MSVEILYSIIGGLLLIIGWLLRVGVSSMRGYMDAGFHEVKELLKAMAQKFDALEDRQAKLERDCVTWQELEKLNLRQNDTERRVTVIETLCKGRHD